MLGRKGRREVLRIAAIWHGNWLPAERVGEGAGCINSDKRERYGRPEIMGQRGAELRDHSCGVYRGLLSGSLALLSDAVHNASDVLSLSLAIWARRVGRKTATYRHTYGFRRAEVIAALVNAIVLLAVTVLIAREALVRLLHPEPVAQGIMLAVGIVALWANVGSVLLLHRHEKDDVNIRSAFLHLAQDALASVAVVIAALFAHTRIGPYVDPAAALLVGVLVIERVYPCWETVSTLLQGTPRDVDLGELVERVGERFSPVTLHHVHLWEAGPGQRIFTAHVALSREMDGSSIETLSAA